MNHAPKPRSSHDVAAAATWLTVVFVVQAVGALLLAAQRDPAATETLRYAGVGSALLAVLALFARTRVPSEPATAAGVVAVLFAAEAAGLAAVVGVPAAPMPLRASVVLLVYGGMTVLTLAAACAALTLRAPARARAMRVGRPGAL
jgi:hypothetical protein